MKKLLVATFLFISVIACSQTIGDVFKTMPSRLLPGISEGNKTMLLVDTGRTVIPYELGQFEKEKHTDTYLRIKTSEVGFTQIKLLPLINNSRIICVIKTVCGNACDSDIKFYSTEWDEIDAQSLLPRVSPEIFFNPEKKDTEKYKFAVSLPDIYPIWAEFIDGSEILALTMDYKKYLSESQLSEIEPFIKNARITLKWDNISFK